MFPSLLLTLYVKPEELSKLNLFKIITCGISLRAWDLRFDLLRLICLLTYISVAHWNKTLNAVGVFFSGCRKSHFLENHCLSEEVDGSGQDEAEILGVGLDHLHQFPAPQSLSAE